MPSVTNRLVHSETRRRRDRRRSICSAAAILATALVSGCTSLTGSTSRPTPAATYRAAESLERRVASRFDRVEVAHLPTPLEDLEVLTAELGGPRILIKRDDQTGLAFGGNKARKLDYIMADARAKGADVIITWAGLQSNWCRQTAAAAAMMGMRSILLLSKRDDTPVVIDGNLLLDAILGADARILPLGTSPSEVAMEIAEEERAAGNTPYIVAVGGSSTGYDMEEPLGAMGYVTALIETHRQVVERAGVPDYVVIPTGSGGTQAGLVVAAEALRAGTKIIGISVSGSAEVIQANVARIATETAEGLGLRHTFSPSDIIVFDDYVGEGYGILNEPTADAIQRVARGEGILLDPVYTGKAMSGLIDLVESGYFQPDDVVVFIHTGGTPALFHYGDELLEYIR
jgi:L-cysteate sulfo-lyase